MLGLWWLGVRWQNMGLVDTGWAACVLVHASVACLQNDGWEWRRLITWLLAAAWSLRLIVHLVQRLAHDRRAEDDRYKNLRARWLRRGRSIAGLTFLMFQFQALLAWVLALPFYLAAQSPVVGFSVLEWSALVLWFMALVGETLADRQLTQFKRNHRDGVCDVGLWRYSRHPNYFFEWLVWCGVALWATSSPHGERGWIAPAIMWLVLTRITGVPYAEAQSLRSRGEAYREYQRRVSTFVPWFRK
ncbi:MAG: DUF1295 domain-containing protein [Bdellovibrionales bacterium]|nr:DUF1295 domain-containing protein [Bdellovibrionales bacterium]